MSLVANSLTNSTLFFPAVQRCEGFGSIFLKEEDVQNSAHNDWTSLEDVSVSYCEEVCLDVDGQVVVQNKARKCIYPSCIVLFPFGHPEAFVPFINL